MEPNSYVSLASVAISLSAIVLSLAAMAINARTNRRIRRGS